MFQVEKFTKIDKIFKFFIDEFFTFLYQIFK